MNELLPYIILDISIIVAIMLLSLRFLNFFHPILYYVLFHVFAISSRSWELLGGRYPMYFRYQNGNYYSAIRPEEFIRALILADISLVLFFAGCMIAKSYATVPRQAAPYNDGLLKQLVIVLLPITFGLLFLRRFGGDSGREVLSGFQLINIMSIWPIALLALAMARWGARWYLIIPAVIYLGLVGTQGYHRVQAFLPLLLLMGVFAARANRRWPSIAVLPIVIAAAIIFPGAKQFGKDVNTQGVSVAFSRLGQVQQEIDQNYNSRSEMLLDQYAGALTAADSGNIMLWGKTYISVLTLPIPRALWPDKPSLGAATLSVAAPGRPYDHEGRIVTIIGESYINFRYVGVFVVMISLGWAFTRYYQRAFSVAEVDAYKIAYIGVIGSLFQVYRDGLPSIVLFSLISMGPLYIYLLLNNWSHGARATALQRAAFRR